MSKQTTRRHFLKAGTAAAVAVVGKKAITQPKKQVSVTQTLPPQTMPERELGKTGISLPILGLGGAGKTPISNRSEQKQALALIETALRLGIRYYDTAADYGPSEAHFGKILPAYREQIYINSKTAARDRDGAWRDLERSLKRLQTDYLDGWQLHHVSFEEELEEIFSNKGAIKAIEEAKAQKIIKFAGITGHHEPEIIAKGMQRYNFDTILIVLNAADVHHPRPFSQKLLPLAQAQKVGVIGMKVPAYGRLFKPGILTGMEQAMGYTLSLPGVHTCIIAAENPEQLESNIRVAQAFQPLNTSQMEEIERLTANAGEDGSFFRKWA